MTGQHPGPGLGEGLALFAELYLAILVVTAMAATALYHSGKYRERKKRDTSSVN